MNKVILSYEKIKTDKGYCYFCGSTVYANEGQLITFLQKLNNEKKELYPTHKKCRKENKL